MTTHYAIIAWDVPDSAQKRADARDAHFAHIGKVIDQIAIAGPLKNDAGDNIGSMLIVRAKTMADAEAMLKQDPYFAAGVWERWTINMFVPAAGEWVGGTTW
jgi:uncharacterized protein